MKGAENKTLKLNSPSHDKVLLLTAVACVTTFNYQLNFLVLESPNEIKEG